MNELTPEQKAVHDKIELLFQEIKNLTRREQTEKAKDKIAQAVNLMRLEFNKLK